MYFYLGCTESELCKYNMVQFLKIKPFLIFLKHSQACRKIAGTEEEYLFPEPFQSMANPKPHYHQILWYVFYRQRAFSYVNKYNHQNQNTDTDVITTEFSDPIQISPLVPSMPFTAKNPVQDHVLHIMSF